MNQFILIIRFALKICGSVFTLKFDAQLALEDAPVRTVEPACFRTLGPGPLNLKKEEEKLQPLMDHYYL